MIRSSSATTWAPSLKQGSTTLTCGVAVRVSRSVSIAPRGYRGGQAPSGKPQRFDRAAAYTLGMSAADGAL